MTYSLVVCACMVDVIESDSMFVDNNREHVAVDRARERKAQQCVKAVIDNCTHVIRAVGYVCTVAVVLVSN